MKLLRFLLFPFAIIYDLVTTFRNFLFDTNIFKQNSFTIPVIVVGNLSVGGTGKTPQIEYLIRLLKNKFQIAVLSRGYKRKTKGFLITEIFSFAMNFIFFIPFVKYRMTKQTIVFICCHRSH